MTKNGKAAEIIDQDGACDGVACDGDCENECPIYKLCGQIDRTSSKSQEKIVACREFLGDPVIGIPRTNAPTKTLLDEFAMAATQGSMASSAYPRVDGKIRSDANGYAEFAYNFAAAMMKERARRDEMGNVKEVSE